MGEDVPSNNSGVFWENLLLRNNFEFEACFS